MLEYANAKDFNSDLEKKKHKHLPNYFIVLFRQEKYFLVSNALKEDVLRTKLTQSVTHRQLKPKAIDICASENQLRDLKACGNYGSWVQGLKLIEEEVMRKVDDEHNEKQRRYHDIRRLTEETDLLLKKQKRRRKKMSCIKPVAHPRQK